MLQGDNMNLDIKELEFILTSLEYTKQNFNNTTYPSQQFKQERITEVNAIIAKVRATIKDMKHGIKY